jgi:hypothetical protein
MSLHFQTNWVAQKNIFFYHFEEFDFNYLIQQKHWNFMLFMHFCTFHYRPKKMKAAKMQYFEFGAATRTF